MAILPTVLVVFAAGAIVPLDRYADSLTGLMLPVLIAALWYVFVGYGFLPNSYGRYLLGVRVVDEATGEHVGRGQALRRALTVGLWPVEALLIAFSATGQRLGDRWARTVVVRYSPEAPWWKRVLPLVLVLAVFHAATGLLIPVINGRMAISRAAQAFAARELQDRSGGAPRQVTVVNDSGTVAMRLSGGRGVRIHLVWSGARWEAVAVENISPDELGWEYSVEQNSTTLYAR